MSTLTAQAPSRQPYTIHARTSSLELGADTKIMGIVNTTPDSFSLDGCLKDSNDPNNAYSLALEHIRNGADIIDVGGESTRPGAESISEKDEISRVIPTIKALAKNTQIPISIDTYKPTVAQAALDAGASMINNIMGNDPDAALLKMIKSYGAAIVLMHIQGTPQTMQKSIAYEDLIGEITGSLQKSIEKCLEIGIKSDRIIVDPGIGFGKTVEHNLEILNRLSEFDVLKRPILIGTSRKSFIGKVLDKEVNSRVMGTAATVTASIVRGAHIVRVHDVKPMKEIALMTDAIINNQLNESL